MADFKGLEAKFAKLKPTIDAAAKAALERYATQIVADMKRLAPRDPTPDGIHLEDHIAWKWGEAPAGATTLGTVKASPKAGTFVTIYANPKDSKGRPYGSWVEFGTRRSSASPFFYPAYRANRKRVRSGVRAAIKRAVKQQIG